MAAGTGCKTCASKEDSSALSFLCLALLCAACTGAAFDGGPNYVMSSIGGYKYKQVPTPANWQT